MANLGGVPMEWLGGDEMLRYTTARVALVLLLAGLSLVGYAQAQGNPVGPQPITVTAVPVQTQPPYNARPLLTATAQDIGQRAIDWSRSSFRQVTGTPAVILSRSV